MTTLSWQEIAVLLILLAVAVSNIASHKRINELEHNLDTLAQRIEQLNSARKDEVHNLRKVTLRGFQRAYNVSGGLYEDDAEDSDNWT